MGNTVDSTMASSQPGSEQPTGSEPPVLSVRLLGGFEVSVGDRVIGGEEWRLRKAAALVKLLSLAGGYRLHREQAMDALWPDLDPAAALNNLHQALHVTRRILEPGAMRHSSMLRLQGEMIVLEPPERIHTDVADFENALAAARGSGSLPAYHSAVALYGGDLLPDDRYEEWADARRTALKNQYLETLLDIGRLSEEGGDPGGAIKALQQAVDCDPALEEAHAALMRLYARIGQRQQALRQYRLLEEGLRHELDAEPDADSRRLYDDILAGHVPSMHSPAHDGPAPERPATRRHNLPIALTTFVGREQAAAEITQLLQSTRLLTLIGTGGAGKTRLALAVAERVQFEYPDGVWLVELAALTDVSLVARTVGSVLGIGENPESSFDDTLVDGVKDKCLLLVLDNCEHLAGACAALARTLLAACPYLRILATSREVLGVKGETIWSVPPLSVPGSATTQAADTLQACESVRLFVDRVRYRQPSFELSGENAGAVQHICRTLEGHPLAIELATARVGVLSLDQIAARLSDSLGLLADSSRTGPARHRTLRAALDWSYTLLTAPEQQLFGRLAVFAGGCVIESVEAIDAHEARRGQDTLDVLSQLVDKSLVVVEAGPQSTLRYRLLEPVRQYARERLEESGEARAIGRAHASLFAELAEQAGSQLLGPDQRLWLRRLETEHDNLRAALVWSSSAEGDPATGLRIVASVWRFWHSRQYVFEGKRWLETMLAATEEAISTQRAQAIQGLGGLAFAQRRYAEAQTHTEAALAIFRELGNRAGIASCTTSLGMIAPRIGQPERAASYLEESLALNRELGDRRAESVALSSLGVIAFLQGDLQRAQALFEQDLAVQRELGNISMVAITLNNLGELAQTQENFERSVPLLTEALSIGREIGDLEVVASCLDGLGRAAYARAATRRGQAAVSRAAKLHGAAQAVRDSSGMPPHPDDLTRLQKHLDTVRAALGDAGFQAAWEAGRMLDRSSAIEFALATDMEDVLTSREREIATLAAKGLTNREIAGTLALEKRTVDTHLSTILHKLGFSSRKQLNADTMRGSHSQSGERQ